MGLASINTELDLGNGFTLANYRGAIAKFQSQLDEYNTALAKLDGQLDDLENAEGARYPQQQDARRRRPQI
jgi:hypothetical protein